MGQLPEHGRERTWQLDKCHLDNVEAELKQNGSQIRQVSCYSYLIYFYFFSSPLYEIFNSMINVQNAIPQFPQDLFILQNLNCLLFNFSSYFQPFTQFLTHIILLYASMSFIILIQSKVYCICLSVTFIFCLAEYPQDFSIVMHMTGFSSILKAELGQIYITIHPFVS